MSNFVAMEEIPPGAVQKEDGTVVFPSTKRPDGTWRKERPIRQLADGRYYVPQDEVQAFQTRAHQARANKPKGVVGASDRGATEATASKSKSARKNEARKKKKEAERAAAEAGGGAEPSGATAAGGETPAGTSNAETPGDAGDAETPQAVLGKKIKSLKKKLKQLDELQAKIDGGYEPNEEQQEKLGRRQAWSDELTAAETDLAALE